MDARIKRLTKNTLFIFGGNFGSKLITLLMLPFYTAWLSVSDYGITDMITVYVSFLMQIVSCCIGDSLFVFPKGKPKKEQAEYFSSAIAFIFVMLVLTAIIFLAIDTTTTLFIGNSFTSYIWLIYLLLIVTIIQQLAQQFTRSIDCIKVYSLSGFVCTVCVVFFSFLLIPKYGVSGYVCSTIIAFLLSALYSFVASKSYTFISFSALRTNVLKKMLNYSIPLVPNGIMWWLVSSMNRPVMEHYLSLQDVGIFAVANKFPAALTSVFNIFALSWQISVLEEFKKGDYSNFYNSVLRIVFSILLCLMLAISLSSSFIVETFVDSDYYEAWKYIPLLSVAVFFSNMSSFIGANFTAVYKSKYIFYSSLYGGFLAVILYLIIIPLWGIWGTCLAMILSFAMNVSMRIYYSWKYVKISNVFYYLTCMIISFLIISLYEYNNTEKYHYLLCLFLLIFILYSNRSDIKKSLRQVLMKINYLAT